MERHVLDAPPERIQFNISQGRLELLDTFTRTLDRAVLVDPGFLTSVFQALLEHAQSAPAGVPQNLFYDLGVHWGETVYDDLQQRLSKTDGPAPRLEDFIKDEFVENLNNFFSYSGLGQFRITEGNRFYMVDLKSSPFETLDPAIRSLADTMIAGLFSGLLSKIAATVFHVVPVETDSGVRFILSTSGVITEIRGLLDAGKTFAEVARQFDNHHFV